MYKMADEEPGYLESIGDLVGAPVEGIRLLIAIFAGYPAAAFYCRVLANNPNKTLHHIFFASIGLALCYFNYGLDTYHSLISILITYLFALTSRQLPKVFLTVNFLFHMGYLTLGYLFTASSEYDILWTMPHCILVLRMIGFGFDIVDGYKKEDKLSKDQKETAIKEMPSLLELMAFAYFPSSFLVGPQYPYRRYQRFINGEYRQYDGSRQAGLKRLLVGVIYLGMSQIGRTKLSDAYFLTDEYKEEMFIVRIVYLGLWGKFTLYKYISCWLITEGALMCFGLTYNGQNDKGESDWYGCSNVKLVLFETGNTMEHYIRSFNVNTNHWVAQYVFKRLKFLNNRNISYGATLSFLAIWHGFHSGYYMTFLMEFLITAVEKQITNVYTKDVLPKYGETLNNSIVYKTFEFIALKSYNVIYMGWCLIAFVFLKYDRWIAVMSAVNYFGFTYMLIWALIYYPYKMYKRSSVRAQQNQTFSQATDLSPIAATNAGGIKQD